MTLGRCPCGDHGCKLPTDEDRVLAAVVEIWSQCELPTVRRIRAVTAGLRAAAIHDALVRLVLGERLIEVAGPRRSRVFIPVGDTG